MRRPRDGSPLFVNSSIPPTHTNDRPMSTKHLNLDPACETRLAWITAYARHALHLPREHCRPTPIIRRAIDAYVVHLERIMRLPDGHKDPTRDRDLANGVERMRLRDMLRDADLGVPIEAVIGAPLRPLSDYVQEVIAQRPPPVRLIDQLRGASRDDDDDE